MVWRFVVKVTCDPTPALFNQCNINFKRFMAYCQ